MKHEKYIKVTRLVGHKEKRKGSFQHHSKTETMPNYVHIIKMSEDKEEFNETFT
jgi:hypothetical protein